LSKGQNATIKDDSSANIELVEAGIAEKLADNS